MICRNSKASALGAGARCFGSCCRAAGLRLPTRLALANRLVLAFLTQAISGGYFHADMHQGNLFVEDDGTIVAIDFGIILFSFLSSRRLRKRW